MSKFFLVLIISLFVFTIFASVSLGHGLGQTLTKETDKYRVELEYEALELIAEEPVEYAFRLIEKNSGGEVEKGVEFDSVAVRIFDKSQDRGVFSTSIVAKDAIGLGPRAYLKLGEGEYTLNLTFVKGEDELAKESFDLVVLPGEGGNNTFIPVGLGFLAGAALGVAFTTFIRKRK